MKANATLSQARDADLDPDANDPAIGAAQLALIERQLGRPPRSTAAVALSTTAGVPLVLRMRPLVAGKPFPTLYWLSSRTLVAAVSRIETQGWVKWWEERLAAEPAWRERYLADQRAYVSARWHWMSHADRQALQVGGFVEALERCGIGGLGDWNRVRCLHMQYAFHLCRPSLIGAWMDEHFQLGDLIAAGVED